MQFSLHDNAPSLFAETDENQYFVRKCVRLNPKETVRHIYAFANASVGKLIIGIEDNGTVTGFRRDGLAVSRSSSSQHG